MKSVRIVPPSNRRLRSFRKPEEVQREIDRQRQAKPKGRPRK